MPDIEINDLAKIGSVKDQEGYQLPPEAFTTSFDMRFTSEGVERMGGREESFGTPPEAPHFLMPIQTPSQVFWLWTSLTKAYAWDGATHTEITRGSGNYNAANTRDWNGLVFGGIAILNNGADPPQYWSQLSTGTQLDDLANWPSNYKAKVLRSLGPHLIAFGITKDGDVFPHMVKWSHPADPGTIPVSWDETDPTKDAGEQDLPDVNAGVIQEALPLRGQMFIYKNNSVWRMRFIGGQFIFSFDTLLESAGILAPRCVALTSDGQKHVFATQDDILIHNGTAAESILNQRMRKYLINTIDPVTFVNSFMFTDPFRDETYFCYPEQGIEQPNKAIVFNSRSGNLTEASVTYRNAAVGIIEQSSGVGWDDLQGSWDDQSNQWSTNTRRKVVVVDTDDTNFCQLDTGPTIRGDEFTGTLQRVGLGVVGRKRSGEWIVDFTKHKFVRRVWIKASGGPFNVRVGFQAIEDGPVTWSSAQSFDPAQKKWIDVAGSGKAVAVEFSSNVPFRIVGYKPELELRGRF